MMGSGMLLTDLMEITDAWRWNDHAILWVIKCASLSYFIMFTFLWCMPAFVNMFVVPPGWKSWWRHFVCFNCLWQTASGRSGVRDCWIPGPPTQRRRDDMHSRTNPLRKDEKWSALQMRLRGHVQRNTVYAKRYIQGAAKICPIIVLQFCQQPLGISKQHFTDILILFSLRRHVNI